MSDNPARKILKKGKSPVPYFLVRRMDRARIRSATGAEGAPDPAEGKAEMKEITLEAKTENLPVVIDLANELLEGKNCSMKTQMQIELAVDEVFTNIACYAYAPATGKATVKAELLTDPDALEMTFIDRGQPYNPLETEEPDVTSSAEERKIGGLGVFLVRKTMDEVRYRYEDGQNILTIRKELTNGRKNQ